MLPFYETRPDEIFAFTTVDPNTIPHMHIQIELMYIFHANIKVTVNQKTQILTDGDLAIVFPNCLHGEAIPLPNTSVNVGIIAVKPHLAGDFSSMIFNFLPENPFLTSENVPEEVVHSIKQLLTLENSEIPNKYKSQLIKSYIQIILALILSKLTLEKSADSEYNLIQKSVKFITENYNQQLTLESVAKHVGVSKCHLSAVFADKLHIGFNQYLNSVRLNSAQDLMQNSNKTITEIAYDCGFGTVRTFNRVFEKHLQTTPSNYRNLQKARLEHK